MHRTCRLRSVPASHNVAAAAAIALAFAFLLPSSLVCTFLTRRRFRFGNLPCFASAALLPYCALCSGGRSRLLLLMWLPLPDVWRALSSGAAAAIAAIRRASRLRPCCRIARRVPAVAAGCCCWCAAWSTSFGASPNSICTRLRYRCAVPRCSSWRAAASRTLPLYRSATVGPCFERSTLTAREF